MFLKKFTVVEVREGGTNDYILAFRDVFEFYHFDFMSCCLFFYGRTTPSVALVILKYTPLDRQ